MNAIDFVNISVAGRPEHRGIPHARSPKTMRSRVVLIIGFHLDQRTSDALHQKDHADQVARNLNHRTIEECAIQLLH